MDADKGGSLAPTFLLKGVGEKADSSKTLFLCPFTKDKLLYFSQTTVSLTIWLNNLSWQTDKMQGTWLR